MDETTFAMSLDWNNAVPIITKSAPALARIAAFSDFTPPSTAILIR